MGRKPVLCGVAKMFPSNPGHRNEPTVTLRRLADLRHRQLEAALAGDIHESARYAELARTLRGGGAEQSEASEETRALPGRAPEPAL